MGVTGLWKLIESSGKPVPVETLENKILAIDISIWLHQVVKGFQDNKGSTLAHAHLLGLFHRLCKLLYYKIKPVFIFDGGVPQLKRETIAKRNQSKNKLLSEAERLETLFLQTLAKEKVIQLALNPNSIEALNTLSKQKLSSRKPDKDDIFKLPELSNVEEVSEHNISNLSQTSDITSTNSESSFDEKNLRSSYTHNLQSIDVTSSQFKSLPADVRHEILIDIKETRKQSSWGRLHELPSKSDEFSSFQMKRLLKRRQVQMCLEEAEKQMEGKSLTLNELRTFLTEEGVINAASTAASTSKQIASDENTRFLLVKDLKKAIETAVKKEEELSLSQKSLNSLKENQSVKNEIMDQKNNELIDEYDPDLQKAIQMSLECNNDNPVYDDKDYESNEIKMNREQRKLLKTAAVSLARTYLIEYGGMNEDEINELLENTQCENIENNDESYSFQFEDKFTKENEIISSIRNEKTFENKSKETEKEIEYISDSDDSDLVEVVERQNPSTPKNSNLQSQNKESSKLMQITVDLTKEYDKNDDIFADIFESNILNTKKIEIKENVNDSKKNFEDDYCVVKIFDEQKKDIKVANSNEIVEQCSNSENILRTVRENLGDFKIKLNDTKSEKINELNVTSNNSLTSKMEHSKPEQILESLKKQIKEIPHLTLDDIKINVKTNPAESKDLSLLNNAKEKNHSKDQLEVIEISNDVDKLSKSNSELFPTDTAKQETISDYFETEYKIKRTPEKSENNEEFTLKNSPKIKSPFFINKSPNTKESEQKKKLCLLSEKEDDLQNGILSVNNKVSKVLFNEVLNEKNNSSVEMKPEDSIKMAAETLKEKNTEEQLKSIASNVSKEKYELELERNRQDRMGTSITEKMSSECKELLKLFGVPYIVAPMEAEAQCAFLDACNLIDGTITDDSDIWLFGGKTVYKNFFNQQKHVLEFRMERIEKLFNVDRKKLIQLAVLVGSDYTSGINGIGAVTALEILAAFPSTEFKEGETTEMMSILSSLRKFREWWHNGKKFSNFSKTALRGKLKNIEISEGFPNMQIIEAYLSPKIDCNREKFSWGSPDVEGIREFTKKNFGWTKIKIDEILMPVMKKFNEKKYQASVKNYFTVKSALSTPQLKVSKRVQKAIDKLSMNPENSDSEDKPKSKKIKKTRKEKTTPGLEENKNKLLKSRKRKSNTLENKKDDKKGDLTSNPSCSSSTVTKPKLSKLLSEADSEIMQKRKEKAAEILKKSKQNKKTK